MVASQPASYTPVQKVLADPKVLRRGLAISARKSARYQFGNALSGPELITGHGDCGYVNQHLFSPAIAHVTYD